MNFKPSRPAVEDIRDGILAAVPAAAQDCLVWKAFAQFGVGVGANGDESGGVSVTESFAIPTACTPNTPPVVSITAPAHNSSFVQGTFVTFSGTAGDAHDGPISSSIAWSSSRNGALGTGASITTGTLFAGTHTIRAMATDSGGLSDAAAISITIVTPTVQIVLSASGRIVNGIMAADLTWNRATSTQVDVY